MTFAYYEQYHLHDYVDRKGTSYTKAESDENHDTIKTLIDTKLTNLKSIMDTKITTLKTEMDKTLAALKIEIINMIPSSGPVDQSTDER